MSSAAMSSAPDSPRGGMERSSYIKMLSNIANDLDLLLTDLCHLYPLPSTSANQKSCFSLSTMAPEDPNPSISPYDSPREHTRSCVSGSKLSLQSEQTSTADSGHDITTPGSLSPEMPLYHVEQVVKKHGMRSASNSPLSDNVADLDQRPISLFERLSKTHAIWLLPDIGRSGAVHLLKDRVTGSFVVRRSSQRDSLALSVQHQQEACSSVDHYIIESTSHGLRLQGSAHYFSTIPHLIEFYICCKEELPELLVLPAVIMSARSPKELSSLALLGQDFWQSRISRHNSSDSLAGTPVLHKSCSEPINITRPTSSFPPELPAKVKNAAPSASLGDFSKFMIDRKHARIAEEAPPVPAMMEESSSRVTVETDVGCCPPPDRVPAPPSGDESEVSHHLHGYREQVDLKSHTHPRASDKGKSSLYFTTSLDLLHIPETSYFRSSLEDKMSDYEDIWKNSVCESDSVKNNMKCNMWTQTQEEHGQDIQRVHNDISPTHNESGISTLSSNGGSLPKNNVHKAIAMSSSHQSRESTHVSCDVRVSQSMHSGRNVVDTYAMSHIQKYQQQMWVVPGDPRPGVARKESPNSSSAPKTKPPPLPNLSRIKSSSTSSLSTLAHSPIYAEPADAVNLDCGRPVSVRIRRRSAPSYSPKDGPDLLRIPTAHPPPKVSQQPQLETILSPRNVPTSDMISDSSSFVFSFGRQQVQEVKVAETRSSRRAVGRSQSMKTERQETHKVTRQRSLKERFARLKTDMLKFRTPDNNKSAVSTPESNEHRPRGASGIDDALFTLEDLETASGKVESPPLNKFPVYKKQMSTELNNRTSCFSESSTVQDMISCAHPEFNVRPLRPLTVRKVKCVSEYDNLRHAYAPASVTESTAGTVFCKPWDNSPLENILHSRNGALQPAMNAEERVQRWQENTRCAKNKVTVSTNQNLRDSIGHVSDVPSVGSNTDSAMEMLQGARSRINGSVSAHQTPVTYTTDSLQSAHVNVALDDTQGGIMLDPSDDDEVIADNLSEVISSDLRDRLRPIVSRSSSHSNSNNPGGKIREYIFRLSIDHNTTFGSTIENFIQCTLESQERNPHHVMRNVRQFMTGIKNYLVKHGEGELEGLIERERTRLGANEFLNIDAIIEGALHVCVLRPVKHHIYKLFVQEHNRSGSLKLMTRNIMYARSKTPEEIGIKACIKPPKPADMELIKHHLDKMQKAYSPLKKLENLLFATSTIYQCVRQKQPSVTQQSMGADDFLPMLIYVMVHCGLVSAEIEAEFMWGLLHPSLLTGEGGYYLTTLSSAVLVLKNFQDTQETHAAHHLGRLPSISDMQGFLKIAIPDELRDSIVWKTLPIRPSMSTKDVCALIAHKFKVTNPQDYGLYLLVDGDERHLADNLCPQMIKGEYLASTQEAVFAYKRVEANIAWPRNLKKPALMQDKV
ncbi:protein sprint-like isoform X3 [Haliotis cracherodii]|uniref:protein sprint-like isoform X3 n=1 Tax=Haliotis cracherodii TaxID=6455 RepID=UPI0039EBA32E